MIMMMAEKAADLTKAAGGGKPELYNPRHPQRTSPMMADNAPKVPRYSTSAANYSVLSDLAVVTRDSKETSSFSSASFGYS